MKRLLRCLAALALALMPLMHQGVPRTALAADPYCLDANDQAFLRLINEYRVANNRSPLTASPTLGAAAQSHSQDMAMNDYSSHTGLDGSTPADRMQKAGYPVGQAGSWGENIYWGTGSLGSAQSAFNWWRNSPGHNANMLSADFRAIGIGWSFSAATGKTHWTTDFGGLVDATATPCGNGPGTQNPSFSGTRLPITNSLDSPNTGNSSRVRDGVTWTNWTSPMNYPDSAVLTLDLGSTKQLTGVKWMFSSLGYADAFEVRLSNSYGGSYTRLGSFGNGTATNTWFGAGVSSSARFVQFVFTNPSNDAVLGAIGEIEIWGPAPSYPPGILNPSFSGAKATITNSLDAPSTGTSSAARDGVTWTNWSVGGSPSTATITFDLGVPKPVTGLRWMFANVGYADQFTVRGSTAYGGPYTSLGTFGNAPSTYTWHGVGINGNYRFIQLVFSNPNHDPALGSVGELEVWSTVAGFSSLAIASPVASPIATLGTPVASPVMDEATPVASSVTVEVSRVASPVASPVILIEEAPIASPVANDLAQATPEILEPVAPTAITEPTPTDLLSDPSPAVAEQVTPTDTATETVAQTSTAEPMPTIEPTAAISQAFISGTGGDLVNCRITPVDGEVIATLAEGTAIEVLGPAAVEWYPVNCDGQQGYVSADFVTLGVPEDKVPMPTTTTDIADAPDASPAAWENDASLGAVEPTATTAVTEPTATVEPANAPGEAPYPVHDAGDTENSGSAWLALDDDPDTWWSVVPNINPDQVRLYVDLGSVVPIDYLTLNLATWDQFPSFEIWLSEDADTWYNATPQGINGWSLDRDVDLVIDLGYDARYVRIVFPDIQDSGLSQVGGIRQIEVWAGNITETQYLSALGAPTTPTPVPVEPTPTDIPEEIVEPTATSVPEEAIQPTATSVLEEIVEPTAEEDMPTGTSDEGVTTDP